jgi:3-hydroxyisobutyrate dehydrogenase-like beta-hydroxyacid dehydrogenase
MTKETLGFIGVGMIGTPMAGRLMDADYGLVVYDIDPSRTKPFQDRGATVADNPAHVADLVETVLVSLPMPAIVKEVALGAQGLHEGKMIKTYVDLSTTGPVVATEVAKGLEAHDITCIDCPVSGGMKGANEGSLSLMVSGRQETTDQLQPIFDVLGSYFFLGEAQGLGQTMKCSNNYVSATIAMALAEVLTVGKLTGLDPAQMLDVMNAGAARSWASEIKFPQLIKEGSSSNMATKLLLKDVSLYMDQADALGMPALAGGVVKNYFTMGVLKGLGDEPSTTMIKVMEEWAGIRVREKEG